MVQVAPIITVSPLFVDFTYIIIIIIIITITCLPTYLLIAILLSVGGSSPSTDKTNKNKYT
jgi:hypothetical protein